MVIAQNDGLANVTVTTSVATTAEDHVVATNTYITSGSQTTSDTIMPRLSVSQGLNPLAPPYTLNNTFSIPNIGVFHTKPYFPNLSAPVAFSGPPVVSSNMTNMSNQNCELN